MYVRTCTLDGLVWYSDVYSGEKKYIVHFCRDFLQETCYCHWSATEAIRNCRGLFSRQSTYQNLTSGVWQVYHMECCFVTVCCRECTSMACMDVEVVEHTNYITLWVQLVLVVFINLPLAHAQEGYYNICHVCVCLCVYVLQDYMLQTAFIQLDMDVPTGFMLKSEDFQLTDFSKTAFFRCFSLVFGCYCPPVNSSHTCTYQVYTWQQVQAHKCGMSRDLTWVASRCT